MAGFLFFRNEDGSCELGSAAFFGAIMEQFDEAGLNS